MRATTDGWIGFLNEEALQIDKLQPALPRGVLRAHLRDRLAEGYDFPLRTVVRSLVVGRRRIEAMKRTDGRTMVAGQPDFLELWPEGLSREAAALTGPILAPVPRRLYAGAVLTVALALENPADWDIPGPGLLARAFDYTVEVAVEA